MRSVKRLRSHVDHKLLEEKAAKDAEMEKDLLRVLSAFAVYLPFDENSSAIC
jgi:hypothetical protein